MELVFKHYIFLFIIGLVLVIIVAQKTINHVHYNFSPHQTQSSESPTLQSASPTLQSAQSESQKPLQSTQSESQKPLQSTQSESQKPPQSTQSEPTPVETTIEDLDFNCDKFLNSQACKDLSKLMQDIDHYDKYRSLFVFLRNDLARLGDHMIKKRETGVTWDSYATDPTSHRYAPQNAGEHIYCFEYWLYQYFLIVNQNQPTTGAVLKKFSLNKYLLLIDSNPILDFSQFLIPDVLIGPIRLTILKNKEMGLTVFLFGDEHVLESKCPREYTKNMEIGDFMLWMAEKTAHTLDYIVEQHINLDDKNKELGLWSDKHEKSYLNNVWKKFEEKETRKQLPKLRYTECDVRLKSNPYAKELGIIKNLIYYIHNTLSESNISYIFEIFQNMKYLNESTHIVLEKMIEKARIDTEIGKIKTQRFRTILNNFKKEVVDYFSNLHHELKESFSELLFNSKKQRTTAEDIINFLLPIKEYYLLHHLSSFQDLYTMARFCHLHEKYSNDSNKKMKNVFFYLGNAHSAYIYRFLKTQLNFEEVSFMRSDERGENAKDHQCLKLTKQAKEAFADIFFE